MTADSSLGTILVIDDDEVVHILSSSIIESMKMRCLSARTIDEARKILETAPSLRLILSDMNLPDGDGLSFLMEGKKKHPECPFVIMSAESLPDAKVKQIPILPDSFLPKPFTAAQLVKTLGELLSQTPD